MNLTPKSLDKTIDEYKLIMQGADKSRYQIVQLSTRRYAVIEQGFSGVMGVGMNEDGKYNRVGRYMFKLVSQPLEWGVVHARLLSLRKDEAADKAVTLLEVGVGKSS